MNIRIIAISALAAVAMPAIAQNVALDDSHLNMLDKDGDGAVSKAEFDEFANFAFEAIDDNGDGTLSPDEVDDHVTGDAFGMLDDDEDGSVSASEFASQMDEDFESADRDGDGVLN
ncbi:MAG: EF-hand domain-containing protein [Pseudomonadota bacterium]